MYEELIEFLLGRKEELTDDDLDNFVDLLANALEITEEYDIHKKQALIANMVKCTNVVDKNEKAEIASAIDKILQFEVSEENGADIFGSEEDDSAIPLRSRKFTRGRVSSNNADDEEKKHGSKRKQTEENSAKKKQADVCTTDIEATANAGCENSGATGEPLVEADEDLLNSVCTDVSPPDNRQSTISEHPVKFGELFSTNSPQGSNVLNSANQKGTESRQFIFDIGELEENHNEGPEYHFRIEDSTE